jgi:hypothetical protein
MASWNLMHPSLRFTHNGCLADYQGMPEGGSGWMYALEFAPF